MKKNYLFKTFAIAFMMMVVAFSAKAQNTVSITYFDAETPSKYTYPVHVTAHADTDKELFVDLFLKEGNPWRGTSLNKITVAAGTTVDTVLHVGQSVQINGVWTRLHTLEPGEYKLLAVLRDVDDADWNNWVSEAKFFTVIEGAYRVEAEDTVMLKGGSEGLWGCPWGVGIYSPSEGVTAINCNEKYDTVVYNVNVPASGEYMLKYILGTDVEGTNITLMIDDEKVSDNPVVNTKNWDSFIENYSDVIQIDSGMHTIMLSGDTDWTWNMDYFDIVLYQAVESVDIGQDDVTIAPADTIQLAATLTPDDATVASVSYESSDPAVATVSETGFVTAVTEGTATITVTTTEGGKTDSFVVTVDDGESSINEDALAAVSMYPNPAADVLTISGIEAGNYTVNIIGITGAEYISTTVVANDVIQLDVNNLPVGSYILTINNGSNVNALSLNIIR